MKKGGESEVRDDVVIVCLLWFEHNSVIHGGASWFAGGIIDRAEKILVDYKQASVVSSLSIQSEPAPSKWDPSR